MKSATQLTDASAELHSVANEAELMEWHDAWMSSDEYIAMSDDEAVMLEAMFQDRSLTFARTAALTPSDKPWPEPGMVTLSSSRPTAVRAALDRQRVDTRNDLCSCFVLK